MRFKSVIVAALVMLKYPQEYTAHTYCIVRAVEYVMLLATDARWVLAADECRRCLERIGIKRGNSHGLDFENVGGSISTNPGI